MLTDYGALLPEQRNILRSIFLDPRARGIAIRLGKRGEVRFGRVQDRTRHAQARQQRPNLSSMNSAG